MAEPRDKLIPGTLNVLILKSLTWGPLHGYAISKWVLERTEEVLRVDEGVLYPALHRLEMVVDDLGIALIRLGRDVDLGIVAEPSLQILGDGLLGRVDIGALVELVQDIAKLPRRVLLGPAASTKPP